MKTPKFTSRTTEFLLDLIGGEQMNEKTIKQIRAEIRETKREMKAMGIRRTSCMNGGLDRQTWQYNARLFKLEQIELRDALSVDQQAALNGMTEGGPSWGSEPVDYFLGGKANVK